MKGSPKRIPHHRLSSSGNFSLFCLAFLPILVVDLHQSGQTHRLQRGLIVLPLSFSVSGIPYSTTDIGAFFVTNSHYMEKGFPGGNENEEYRELYTRWFWFSAFSPLFRSHGTDTPREMWFFGEPGTEYYDAQMAASRMRYSLMPYLYAAAFDVYDQDKTLMRPLIMDFPKDQNLKNSSDSYLFGPDLLVHIITEYGQRSAQVYLPEGTEWVDFFSGTRYAGGQTVTVDAPLNRTPMFVKSGSILLMMEPAECTAQLDESHLKLRLFTGKDCSTSYYQDDGDNYSYENGNYMKIPFAWNESRRELTIGEPTGNTDGFSAEKTIEIYEESQYLQTVNYTGQKITLSL